MLAYLYIILQTVQRFISSKLNILTVRNFCEQAFFNIIISANSSHHPFALYGKWLDSSNIWAESSAYFIINSHDLFSINNSNKDVLWSIILSKCFNGSETHGTLIEVQFQLGLRNTL